MGERWSVLIVDGSDDARAEVRRALQQGSERQYNFVDATTGTDALATLNTLTPTCLVLDYHLPDMKAPDILAAVSQPSGLLWPVVVLTDDADRHLAREAIRAGATDCLAKGWINSARLTDAVENAVERHGLLQERVRALDRLREGEVHAKLALEASGTGLWEWNIGTGAVSWSAECYAIFGLSIEGFDGTAAGFDRLLFPGDRERVWEAVRAAVRQRARYEAEFRIVRPGGEIRWVSNIGRAVHSEYGPKRMLGTITDITERKASEAALRDSRQRLAATQAHAPLGIVELTRDGRYVSVNDAFCKIVGYTRDELLGRTFGEITFADDLPGNQALFDQLTTGAIPSFRFEKRFVRKDGTLVSVDVHHRLIESCSGAPAYVIGAVVDLTDRKRSEAALREVDERFRAMADAAPVLIWETDESGVVFVNGHYLAFFGTDFEVICGMGWAQFLHPDDAAGYLAAYQAAFAAREPYSYECRFRRASGEYRWLLNTGRPFGNRGFVGFSADITDSKRIGAALRESEAASRGSGQGSEFVVRLPLTPAVHTLSSDHATNPAPPALDGLRVLVADDNMDATEMLATWLASNGCEVRTVSSGAAAVQEVERFRPAVALVDLTMPGLDGFEVSRRIRQKPWAASVTLVALTGWGQEEDRRRSIAAGFAHHLVKPVDLDRLVDLLQSIEPEVRT